MGANDYNNRFINKIRDVVDNVMHDVQKSGVNIAASHIVQLVRETRIGEKKSAGKKGEVHFDIETLKHNPRVNYSGRWMQDEATNSKTIQGDAYIEQIHQKYYSREDLMSADFWLIDGEAFKVINSAKGVFDSNENGIFWTAVLRRAQQNEVNIEDLTKNKQP